MDSKYQRSLIKIIRKQLPTCKIYLFGSRAYGVSETDSDIDLALDNGVKIDLKIMNKMSFDIAESTVPFYVDLVDLNNISDSFLEHIQQNLIEWKI